MTPVEFIEQYEYIIDGIAYKLTQGSNLFEDLKQDMLCFILELGDITNIPYTVASIKYKAIDIFRSKRYHYSYADKFKHIHMRALSKVDVTWEQLPELNVVDYTADLYNLDVVAGIVPCFEDEVIDKVYRERLLQRLPDERLREIIELYFLQGWTHREIGEMMGVSRRYVTWLVKKAITHLRKRAGV